MCFKLSPSEINSAFKTLSALIFVFILSWTPYNLLLIIRVLMEPGQKATVCILIKGQATIISCYALYR